MAIEIYDGLNTAQLYYAFQGSKYIFIIMLIAFIALILHNVRVLHTGKGVAFNRASIVLLICMLLTVGLHVGFKSVFKSHISDQSWIYVLNRKQVNPRKLTLSLYNARYDFKHNVVYLTFKDTTKEKIVGLLNSL